MDALGSVPVAGIPVAVWGFQVVLAWVVAGGDLRRACVPWASSSTPISLFLWNQFWA